MDTKIAKPIYPQLQSELYDLIIPMEVEMKIRTICKNIWDNEWSGILFYTHTGSIEDNDLKITCTDIFVLDIGSATFTSFSMSPEIVDYIAENPSLADCQMGLIHSHNNMATFFSGTDLQTLQEEGKERNHFLSLIVNNKGDYTAAITRYVKHTIEKHDCLIYKTFNDKEVTSCEDSVEATPYIVEYFKLNISIEDENKDLITKLDELKRNKEKVSKNSMVRDIPFVSTNRDHYFPNNSNYSKNSGEDKKPKELNLFNDYLDYSPTTPSYSTIPTSLIGSAVCQLLTGCIVADESKLNITSWVTKMEKVFDRRFNNLKDFELFADSFVENIIYSGSELDAYDEDSIQEFVEEIIVELKKLPQNKYITTYIKVLKNLIV